jgi:hypothetical protein
MPENLIIYGAVYDHVDAALAGLDSFEKLYEQQSTGPCDAAVIEAREGLPCIVKRMEHPTVELIPELVARGRPPIGVLPEPLAAGETALVVAGPGELEKAFTRAAGHPVMTSKRALEPGDQVTQTR